MLRGWIPKPHTLRSLRFRPAVLTRRVAQQQVGLVIYEHVLTLDPSISRRTVRRQP